MSRPIRIAARAIIVRKGAVLLVNAFPGTTELWCAPGGGGVAGEGLTETLVREVREETGLTIAPGALAGVSEFHNPEDGFHQVDIFFHAKTSGDIPAHWTDPEGIVVERRWATAAELATLDHKPDHLAEMAFRGVLARYNALHLMSPKQRT
ncbi:MAG: NUDIX hydrolase [Pseudomonadota bacterium]